MNNLIKKWWRSIKDKNLSDNIMRLKSDFYVKERNGSMWVMHNGDAIRKLPPSASSKEIIRILNETRSCAVEYAFGNESITNTQETVMGLTL